MGSPDDRLSTQTLSETPPGLPSHRMISSRYTSDLPEDFHKNHSQHILLHSPEGSAVTIHIYPLSLSPMHRHGPMATGPCDGPSRHGIPLRREPQRHPPRQACDPRLRTTTGATMPRAKPSLGARKQRGWKLFVHGTNMNKYWKPQIEWIWKRICLLETVTFRRLTLRFRGSCF